MAATKKAPSGVKLTDLERGHAAHLLSNVWHERNTYGFRATRREKTTRRYSDLQVAALLFLPVEEMVRVRKMYAETVGPWPEDRVREAIVGFLKKQKRWPTRSDFRPPTRQEHGLPSEGVYVNWNRELLLSAWLTVPKNVRSLAPAVVLAIRNVTLRAAAIEAFGGYDRIVQKGGGTLRQQDDFGKLWELPPEPDITENVALFVEVVNATEVDGKRERFFLRVPPETQTAKAAVEWSFGLPAGRLEEFAAAT